MSKAKIAVTMDEQFIKDIDMLIRTRIFQNRSQAIQKAVQEKLERLKHIRLAQECSKLNIPFEKAMAEEGMTMDVDEWPKY